MSRLSEELRPGPEDGPAWLVPAGTDSRGMVEALSSDPGFLDYLRLRKAGYVKQVVHGMSLRKAVQLGYAGKNGRRDKSPLDEILDKAPTFEEHLSEMQQLLNVRETQQSLPLPLPSSLSEISTEDLVAELLARMAPPSGS